MMDTLFRRTWNPKFSELSDFVETEFWADAVTQAREAENAPSDSTELALFLHDSLDELDTSSAAHEIIQFCGDVKTEDLKSNIKSLRRAAWLDDRCRPLSQYSVESDIRKYQNPLGIKELFTHLKDKVCC
jgi:hypothetical protein